MAGSSWYDFVPNQYLTDVQLDANFDWIEGNVVPMLAGTKADNTYDLGEESYMWRNVYVGTDLKIKQGAIISFYTNTSYISGDSTTIEFVSNNTATAFLKPAGFYLDTNAGYYLDKLGYCGIYSNTSPTVSLFIRSNNTNTARFQSNDILINSSGKIYLDGVIATGDTYIYENTANVCTIVAGGFTTASINNECIQINGTPAGVPASNAVYKDNIVKAWVSFNGSAFAENDSFNVASITDNGTGDYTIVWNKDFADTNYAVFITIGNEGGTGAFLGRVKNGGVAVGSVRIECVNLAGTAIDPGNIYVLAIGAQ